MRTAKIRVLILYFHRELCREGGLAEPEEEKGDRSTYALGLLPIENRKTEITRPAMRNWLTALKYLIPGIPKASFSKDDVKMT